MCYMCANKCYFVCIIHGSMITTIIPMCNVLLYLPLKNLGKKVHIVHSKIQYLELIQLFTKFVNPPYNVPDRSSHD